jgi:hypothetical protein
MTADAEAAETGARHNQSHAESKHPRSRGAMAGLAIIMAHIAILRDTAILRVLRSVGDVIGGARVGDKASTATTAAAMRMRMTVIIATTTMRRRRAGHIMKGDADIAIVIDIDLQKLIEGALRNRDNRDGDC